MRRLAARLAVSLALILGTVGLAGSSASAEPADRACQVRRNLTYQQLLTCVDVDGIRRHQADFQAIADANGGNRAAGTPGYAASVGYVVDQLTSYGYEVTTQEFTFNAADTSASVEQVSPTPTNYAGVDAASSITNGTVEAQIVPVDLVLPPGPDPNTSTSACEATDFDGFPAGAIALIQRGTCTFVSKIANAEAAGASAVVLFNEGQPGRTGIQPFSAGGSDIPVVTAAFAVGQALADAVADASPTPVIVRLTAEFNIVQVPSWNVIAESPWGDPDNVVMAGAHLDSVPAGPGINDNGSGSATLLDMAEAMANSRLPNKIRFGFWGAEELGLIGSRFYAQNLTDEEVEDIGVYLNFDMVGSPNFGLFVYDAAVQPAGSLPVQHLFEGFFADRGWETELIDVGSRSDHAGFRARGIPLGGLFTGAEGIKTPEQVAKWGGVAGEQLDQCYHQSCDTLDNVSLTALDLMSDAAAYAMLTYAISTETIEEAVQP